MYWYRAAASTSLLLGPGATAALGVAPRVDVSDVVRAFVADDQAAARQALDGGPPALAHRVGQAAEALWITAEKLPDGAVVGSFEPRGEPSVHAQRLATLGQLTGAITHDFNNYVTVIAGLAEAALEDAPGGPQAADLTEIRAAAHRAASLAHRLLDFARPRATAPVEVSPDAVIERLEGLLHPLVKSGARLHTRLEAPDHRVTIDPVHLEQVLINLVLNARDAMPEGGRIELSTEARSERLLITVRDEGTGMPEDVRARIFDPFFTTKAEGGTGLGLTTVRRIVEGAGGRVGVDSAVGAGSAFFVELPARAGERA